MKFKRHHFILGIIGLFSANISTGQTQPPNIVLIVADDFGYGSLNSYGADKKLVRTPHIDRLAEQGMRFTHAHTPASICTPTRYGILTGQYPWRSKLKFGVTSPIDELLPDPERVTVADYLKERGYTTAHIGKWHLGYGKEPLDYTQSMTPGPVDLGFDYHFGVPQNHGDMLGVYIENDHIYNLKSEKVDKYSRTFYGPAYIGYDAPQRVDKDVMDELTDRSIEWIKKQTKTNPFFLYFAAVAVHHPITPSDYMRGLSDCGPYGDFIQDLDLSVGRIIETLEYKGLMENTIVVFTSDNGGEIPGNKPEAPEITAIQRGLRLNGNLRGDKHTIWQGGTNVPLIVSWKGRIAEGSVSEDLVNLVDIFATLAETAGDKLSGSKDVAPDSFSFLPSLLNKENTHPRLSMVTADAKGMKAVQTTEWKFVDNTPPENFPENWMNQYKNEEPQLYNLKKDPAEQENLVKKYPEKAKELLKELSRINTVHSTR